MDQPKLTIYPDQHTTSLGDLYGIFFEDLNHAADGGLYAEMIQNRSFEFDRVDNPNYQPTYGWSFSKPKAFQIGDTDSLNLKNRHYLEVQTAAKSVTLQNNGFNQGIFLEKNHQYQFSLFAKPLLNHLTISVSVVDSQGQLLTPKQSLLIESRQWQKYQVTLTANQRSASGRLQIEFPGKAHVLVDMVSLFPVETFNHRPNYVRQDLAAALKALHPKFMRFPGGCLTHDGTLNIDARDSLYRWKNTLGPVEQRPARRNNWLYNQTLGLGFYEYFQLCEDIGAKPLPVMAAGYDPHHQRKVPLNQLDEWVDDALDLIEFANGSTDTKWGKIRAKLGHKAPFNLEYLAIGNEEVGDGFRERYPYFHRAIREKYPNIKIINSSGPFAGGGEFELGWQSAKQNGSDFVDEHYYETPNWFLANQHRYDHYDSKGPKVFLGEYASKANKWFNAVVEASYMIGLERNADKVGLACYAPLFCNVAYQNWQPDLIFFDQQQVTPSVNYYVQQLFMTYQGTENVAYQVTNLPTAQQIDTDPLNGEIGFEADRTDVEFSNIVCEDSTHQKQVFDDLRLHDKQRQSLGKVSSDDYQVEFDFKKTGGQSNKGAHFFFGHRSKGNEMMLMLGGWANADLIIKQFYHGRDSDWNQYDWHVEVNRTYHCKVQVQKRHITVWIDGKKLNDVEITPIVIQPVYTNVTFDQQTQRYFVKAVNVTDHEISLQVDSQFFAGGSIYRLTGDPEAENQLGDENQISQLTKPFKGDRLTIPPYSVNVLQTRPNPATK